MDANWETNEAHLQITNVESSYLRMLKCTSPYQLSVVFRHLDDAQNVDWEQIWQWTTEDREQS